jgi:hypothetical protein
MVTTCDITYVIISNHIVPMVVYKLIGEYIIVLSSSIVSSRRRSRIMSNSIYLFVLYVQVQ